MKELMQRVERIIDGWNEYAGESTLDRDDLKSLKATVYNAIVADRRQSLRIEPDRCTKDEMIAHRASERVPLAPAQREPNTASDDVGTSRTDPVYESPGKLTQSEQTEGYSNQ